MYNVTLYLVPSLLSITASLQIHPWLGEDDMDMMELPVMHSYGTWLAQWKQYRIAGKFGGQNVWRIYPI